MDYSRASKAAVNASNALNNAFAHSQDIALIGMSIAGVCWGIGYLIRSIKM